MEVALCLFHTLAARPGRFRTHLRNTCRSLDWSQFQFGASPLEMGYFCTGPRYNKPDRLLLFHSKALKRSKRSSRTTVRIRKDQSASNCNRLSFYFQYLVNSICFSRQTSKAFHRRNFIRLNGRAKGGPGDRQKPWNELQKRARIPGARKRFAGFPAFKFGGVFNCCPFVNRFSVFTQNDLKLSNKALSLRIFRTENKRIF